MHGLQVRSLNLQAFAYLHRNGCFPRTTRLLGRLDIAAVDNSSLQNTSMRCVYIFVTEQLIDETEES